MNLARKAITRELTVDGNRIQDSHAVLTDEQYTYASHVIECLLSGMPTAGKDGTEHCIQTFLCTSYSFWEA